METQEWLSVREVADRVGLTEERIRQLIRAQEIRATKLGGWLIRPSDLNEFIKSRSNMTDRPLPSSGEGHDLAGRDELGRSFS